MRGGGGTDVVAMIGALASAVTTLQSDIDSVKTAIAGMGGGGLQKIVPCTTHMGSFVGPSGNITVKFNEQITNNSVVELITHDIEEDGSETFNKYFLPVGVSVNVSFLGTLTYNIAEQGRFITGTAIASTTGVKFSLSGGGGNSKYTTRVYFDLAAYVF